MNADLIYLKENADLYMMKDCCQSLSVRARRLSVAFAPLLYIFYRRHLILFFLVPLSFCKSCFIVTFCTVPIITRPSFSSDLFLIFRLPREQLYSLQHLTKFGNVFFFVNF